MASLKVRHMQGLKVVRATKPLCIQPLGSASFNQIGQGMNKISGCTMHHPRPRDPLDHPRPVELLSLSQAPKEPEPPPAKTSGIWSKILEPQWLGTLQSLRTMMDNELT